MRLHRTAPAAVRGFISLHEHSSADVPRYFEDDVAGGVLHGDRHPVPLGCIGGVRLLDS